MRREDEQALRGWGVCWGAAMLFSLAATPGRFTDLMEHAATPTSSLEVAIAVLAFLVVLRASSLRWLAALAVAQLLHTLAMLPEVPNHRWIVALVNLALLLSLSPTATRKAPLAPFVAAARAIVVAVYGFAWFAKLNRDFLDPSVSCATQFYTHVVNWWPVAPDGPELRAAVVLGTIAVEATLAAGLCIRPLRRAVVLVGLGFHFLLALDVTKSFVNFSSVMSALLLLFLPLRSLERLADAWSDRARARLAAGLLSIWLAGFTAVAQWDDYAPLYFWVRQLVWSVYSLTLLAGVAAWPAGTETRGEARLVGPPAIAAMLAVLNGISPYLGFKTRTAFDMYSNLRLEADRSNHLFVPRSADLLGALRDRVQVVASNVPSLDAGARAGYEISRFELGATLARVPGAWARYRRHAEAKECDSRHDARLEVPPAWQRALCTFRPIGERSRAECLW